jgi:serine protease Do
VPPEPPDQASGYRRFQNPNVFYEPWQEPVYRQAGAPAQEPYSPGIHSGSHYANQRNQVYQHPQANKKTGAWKTFVKVVCLVLVCALAAGGATFGVLQLTGGSRRALSESGSAVAPPSAAQETPAASPEIPGVKMDLTATGAVMSPRIYTPWPLPRWWHKLRGEDKRVRPITSSPVSGSGFIISGDGYIVTNYHVIQYAVLQGSELTVMTHDGKSYSAKVIGHEQDNDLAVIKVDASGLNAAVLGTNKNMKVGNKVYAVEIPWASSPIQ